MLIETTFLFFKKKTMKEAIKQYFIRICWVTFEIIASLPDVGLVILPSTIKISYCL